MHRNLTHVHKQHSDRLEICQKIYTTQFSGERILHTENANINWDFFPSNKQQKCIIISNLVLGW